MTKSNGIRLRVAYKSPESLMGELTKSVGRGGVRIESKRTVPLGTRFVFELLSVGVKEPVEVFGTVSSVTESSPGRYVLHIRYDPPAHRTGLDAVMTRLFSVAKADKKRKHARVPVHVRAVEDRPGSPVYRLRDISVGGAGIDVEGEKLPLHIRLGVPFLLQMKLTTGNVAAPGEVVWAISTHSQGVPPRIGVAFAKLAPKMEALLEDLIALRGMPAPPWIARLSFGPNALAGKK